jgi:D-alanyl-lipoteichoic acid acyltransferase DltB (MBOAT superfamily)
VLFNSPQFAVFFPLVTLGFYALPHKFRVAFLLAASLGFYMAWRPFYVIVLLLLIGIDYVAGRAMANRSEPGERRRFLFLSLAANLGLLFVFKYYAFFMAFATALLHRLSLDWQPPLLAVVLPVGISFHTFQAMGYTSDVYRGRVQAERRLDRFALFVTYFPQLVAGPIERAASLLPQLTAEVRFDGGRVADGLRTMAWGLFKKVVVADRMARAVDVVYSAPAAHDGPALAIATLCFAIQIYGDFSGYSDMAIGAAKVLGVDLVQNFRTPYLARSVHDFWHRWHISLSSWFRDYLYVPMGGNRTSLPRWCFNVLVVFLLSGLWHGANWTFVAWGAFHGLWLVASRLSARFRTAVVQGVALDRLPRVHAVLQTLTTFALVTVGWVFFRASSLGNAVLILRRLGSGWAGVGALAGSMARLDAVGGVLGLAPVEVALALFFGALLLFAEWRAGEMPPMQLVARQPAYVRWPTYYALVTMILLFGVFDDAPFLYFQF